MEQYMLFPLFSVFVLSKETGSWLQLHTYQRHMTVVSIFSSQPIPLVQSLRCNKVDWVRAAATTRNFSKFLWQRSLAAFMNKQNVSILRF